ncbi:hypothetical protein A2Z33_06165 [Candidatus Gottesmanbacteria bacterium RBG_16_52_11]|uniref:PsbP C-terminal domain-containing protein n=1 Tax=Candidatus Gottesmanbacteria bacterium RBG_16_52_11 TaxID=1798374 RepID=A0A1F5YXD1_9BACT|nr:MAG: hypothetical protein A2Z33_06165 [Candidatus Gottesmanbacteria bacterium RBG_16_52_11]
MRQKGFAPIIIIILAVLVAIVYFLYKSYGIKPQKLIVTFPNAVPAEFDVTDWKTFKSAKGGFEFKYRPDLKVSENTSNEGVLINNSTTNFHDDYELFFHTTITLTENNGLSLEQFALTLCGDEKKADKLLKQDNMPCREGIINNTEVYSNNEIKGIKFYYNSYENTYLAIIFPSKDISKYLLLLSATETGGDGPTAMGLRTIDQILSTFKFTQ